MTALRLEGRLCGAGFYILTFCVVMAPIAWGGNDAAISALLGLLLAAAWLTSLAVEIVDRRTRRLLGATLLLALAFTIWPIVQAVPLPLPLPAHPIWAATDALIGMPERYLTVSRYQPVHSVGYVLMPIACFACCLVFLRDEAKYTKFLHVVLACAGAVAVLSIIEFLLSADTLLGQRRQHYVGSFTGTFVNPNTAATYFGICLLLSLSRCFREVERVTSVRSLGRRRGYGREPARQLGYFAALSLLFATALLLTRSRAGIASALVGVAICTSIFAFILARKRWPTWQSIAVAAMAAGVTLALFSLFGGRVLDRLHNEGLDAEGRWCIYATTWRAILAHPWSGTGLGTFQDVFPTFRPAECGLDGYWEMAHSFFLEGWQSLGTMFIVAAVIATATLVSVFVSGIRNRRRFRFVPLAGLGQLFTLTIHSLFDFSLQVPGLAIVAAAALGSAAAMSMSGDR